MDNYEAYLRTWTRDWAVRISRRAGIEPGKGGRGKKDDPDRRLAQQLGISYVCWLKYKAGAHAPNSSTFKVAHAKAIELQLLGKCDLAEEAEIDRLEPMSRKQWRPHLSLHDLAREQIRFNKLSAQLDAHPEMFEEHFINVITRRRPCVHSCVFCELDNQSALA